MGTAENWYKEAMAIADARLAKADRFEMFKRSPTYEHVVSETINEVLKSDDHVVEAIGPDGWQFLEYKPYPFQVERYRKYREAEAPMEAAFLREVAKAIESGDEAELGRLVMKHARRYVRELAEDIVLERFQ